MSSVCGDSPHLLKVETCTSPAHLYQQDLRPRQSSSAFHLLIASEILVFQLRWNQSLWVTEAAETGRSWSRNYSGSLSGPSPQRDMSRNDIFELFCSTEPPSPGGEKYAAHEIGDFPDQNQKVIRRPSITPTPSSVHC